MTSEQRDKCHVIIHGASVAAAGAASGMAQIPGSDNAVITPIQIGMTIALAGVFDVSITKSAAKALLRSGTVSKVGRTASQFLLGWIPGFGNAINATTAASVTEALGWALANKFDSEY